MCGEKINRKLDKYAWNYTLHTNSGFKNRILSLRINRPRRENAHAILAYYSGELEKALDIYTWLLCHNNNGAAYDDILINFGYLLSFKADQKQKQKIWEDLSNCYTINDDKIDVRVKKILLSLAIDIDIEKKDEYVYNNYISKYIVNRVKSYPDKPIFHLHIPKCGGTSLYHTLKGQFYKDDIHPILPGYDTAPLLKYCVNHYIHVFPYIRSGHLGIEHFDINNINAYVFTVLRDPVKRLLSMYRQSSSRNINGKMMRTIPAYGYDWRYWCVHDFYSWVDELPPSLLQRQLTTFSRTGDVRSTRSNLGKIDRFIISDQDVEGFNTIFNDIGLDLTTSDMPSGMNKSPRNVKTGNAEQEYARQIMEAEESLLDRLQK